MADSDSMETRQLLRAQTQLMMALRSGQLDLNIEQKNIKEVLGHQAEALGGMLLSLTSMQDRFNYLDRDVADLSGRVDGLSGRVDGLSGRVDGLSGRVDGMDQRQDRMDRNIVAIMRHLGVELARMLFPNAAIDGTMVQKAARARISQGARMRKARIAALANGAATLAVIAIAGTAPAATAIFPAAPAAHSATALPAIVVRPGTVRVGNADAQGPPTTAYCEANYKIACFEPGQIRAAYNLPAVYKKGVTGKGATIVIVDSFGSPTIAHDLAVFDKQFGYPAPPSFKVITPAGKIPPYNPQNGDMVGWAGETTLDVEYAHTIAPGANILLVETPVSETEGVTGFPQIVTAEEYVINHHLGDVISQSFSATEETFTGLKQLAPLRAPYIDAYQHHVTVLAASGDSGATDVGLDGTTYYLYPVTSWPDSDPLVTGVGGTQLHQNANGTFTSTVWNDTYNKATNEFGSGNAGPNPLASGGGKSIFFGRPWYQDGVKSVVGNSRGVPDISMSGACDGGVDVYQSFAGQPAGWYPICGTSESTPEFAGIVALADQVANHPLGLINPVLYALSAAHAPGIVDVTKGNNTVSFTQGGKLDTVKGFSALPGYDLASGVGTVNALYFVYELAGRRR
jgi:hypothetical protein